MQGQERSTMQNEQSIPMKNMQSIPMNNMQSIPMNNMHPNHMNMNQYNMMMMSVVSNHPSSREQDLAIQQAAILSGNPMMYQQMLLLRRFQSNPTQAVETFKLYAQHYPDLSPRIDLLVPLLELYQGTKAKNAKRCLLFLFVVTIVMVLPTFLIPILMS